MSLLDQEKADLTSLDAGEVFVGGRYHSLVPIMQEVYPGINSIKYIPLNLLNVCIDLNKGVNCSSLCDSLVLQHC